MTNTAPDIGAVSVPDTLLAVHVNSETTSPFSAVRKHELNKVK
jgi:hypothetical protein